MSNHDVATVTIVFSKLPGGPSVSVADVVAWVEGLMEGREPDGPNGLRYSTARVVSAAVIEK